MLTGDLSNPVGGPSERFTQVVHPDSGFAVQQCNLAEFALFNHYVCPVIKVAVYLAPRSSPFGCVPQFDDDMFLA
ncbi:hypothetical protein DIJ64_10250 [Mycobacterium leprae]|uniref:Uncharacterized protein n=1 Tax=Mycobacterium leprae TaxID=1769 RepID=A0AAD2JE44_MYCLR|nr:hypothetical protein DIJ64_10250 [Mycobacterium leprae]